MQRFRVFNNKVKQMNNKNHPEGEKQTGRQAGRQAGRQKTGAQSNMKLTGRKTHERQRISPGLQTPGGYIGRQTMVTRETQFEQPLKQ